MTAMTLCTKTPDFALASFSPWKDGRLVKTMKYDKPEIKAVKTALEAVHGSMTKPGFLLEGAGYYGTAAAYEADE
jgi:hypothetical protein